MEEQKSVQVEEKTHMKPVDVEKIYLEKMGKSKKQKKKLPDLSNAQRAAEKRKQAKKKKKNKKKNSQKYRAA